MRSGHIEGYQLPVGRETMDTPESGSSPEQEGLERLQRDGGLAVVDDAGGLCHASRGLVNLLGSDSGELAGQAFGHLLLNGGDSALVEQLNRLFAGQEPARRIKARLRRADGSLIDVRIELSPFSHNKDRFALMRIERIVEQDDDYSERRHDRLFRQVFEASEDAVLLIDGDQFIDCNPAAVRMLRCQSKRDILPVPPWGVSPEYQPDGRPSAEKALEMIRTAQENSFHRFEWVHKRSDGEDFPVEVTLTPIELDGREIIHTVWNDITERKRNEKKIERLARYDLLTDLPNRRLLQENATGMIESCSRQGKPLGVMYMDLDRFKDINDTQGHEMGDRVLTEVARRLRTCLRETDTVARLGGDEFAFLLPDTDIERMHSVAGRIVEALEAPFQISGMSTRISASIGMVSFPEHGTTLAELLKHADIAMYRAKDQHSGCCLFQPEQASNVLERVNLERELRQAIDSGKIIPYYQPIVEAHSGRICCVEVLARWPRPGDEQIPPDVFIPMAEATGLINALGASILEQVCRQAERWRGRGMDVRVSLNLSAQELELPQLTAGLLNTLEQHGLDGRVIEIELTESTVMSNATQNVAKLAELKAHHIRVSIDDFGTGYSSLSQLKKLPVDTLKIDQSFVRDMVDDPADANIVETIVLLARAMGLKTIAEGIETEAQFRAARDMGCDMVQGYLFARPLAPEMLEPILKQGRIELPRGYGASQ